MCGMRTSNSCNFNQNGSQNPWQGYVKASPSPEQPSPLGWAVHSHSLWWSRYSEMQSFYLSWSSLSVVFLLSSTKIVPQLQVGPLEGFDFFSRRTLGVFIRSTIKGVTQEKTRQFLTRWIIAVTAQNSRFCCNGKILCSAKKEQNWPFI